MTVVLAAVFASAALALYWHQSRQRLMLDLFERRFEVYVAARRALAILAIPQRKRQNALALIFRAGDQAPFLFGPDVSEPIARIYALGSKRNVLDWEADQGIESERERIGAEFDQIERELDEIDKGLTKLFEPYLAIRVRRTRWPWVSP